MRIFVIVPAEAAARTGGGLDGCGDLVLDLAGADPAALAAAARSIGGVAGRPSFSVYVSGLTDPRIGEELCALMPMAPRCIFVDAAHGRDVADLGSRLAVHEAESGLTDGTTAAVAVIASSFGVLNAGSFVGASPRLAGLAWHPDALAAELGIPATTGAGRWSAPLVQARGLVRLAAAAARIDAIDAGGAVDEERDGFSAVLTREAP